MEEEIKRLRAQLVEKDKEIEQLQRENLALLPEAHANVQQHLTLSKSKLSNEDIARFSRQLILPELGVQGQLKLSCSSVLIVGCGGLGCPAALYLAAGGIGRLGLLDYDEVDLSNLHRQVLHTQSRIGATKSSSAAHACKQLNPSTDCIPYRLALTSENALELIQQYDIILDCTDNVATRYLLNDACILANKILVSGSALRFEGQLTLYNCAGGPCYRCLFPEPPPADTVTNCSDGGVLGVVPGIIGCLQALEALKVAAGLEPSFSQKLLLFDALDGTFRNIKLRPKKKDCVVCGENPTVTKLIDYEQFCGAKATDKDKGIEVLGNEHRITVSDYKSMLDLKNPHVLVDVRQPVELEICKLPMNGTLNIPIDQIKKEKSIAEVKEAVCGETDGESKSVIVVCRRGNDSQLAVNALQEALKDSNLVIKDIKGGLTAWAKQVDKDFPVY